MIYVLTLFVVALVALNIGTTIGVLVSDQYSRKQQVVQMTLLWLFPGFALVVFMMLSHEHREASKSDGVKFEQHEGEYEIAEHPGDYADH